MSAGRKKSIALNSLASAVLQLVTILNGLIIPRLLLEAFGSEVNGMIASITQFIGLAALFQGGITGAARTAFYKPLAENDKNKISTVYVTAGRYFHRFSVLFAGYVIVLGIVFPYFGVPLSSTDTFLLVIVLGMTGIFEYLFGLSNQLLLFADQKGYINTILQIGCVLLSALASFILIQIGASIIVVKLAAGTAMIIRPILLNLYVKEYMGIDRKVSADPSVLNQSNAALMKSIAFYVHSNTDTIVLTLFTSMSWVSVYAVHKYVVGSVSSLVSSVLANLEASFGNLFAEKKEDILSREVVAYDLFAKVVSACFFVPAYCLIDRFVVLYTTGINDAPYHQPVFAVLFLVGELLYCTGLTYHNMIMAAGHIRNTKGISIAEAVINLSVSVITVHRFGLVGVATGTLAAFLFTTAANYLYVRKNIFRLSGIFVLKEYCALLAVFVLTRGLTSLILPSGFADIMSFLIYGALTFICSLLVIGIIFAGFFPGQFSLRKLLRLKQ